MVESRRATQPDPGSVRRERPPRHAEHASGEAHPIGGGVRRVVHVDLGREWRGGQRQALLLIEELRRRGVECLCAFRARSPLAERAGERGFQVLPFAARGEWDLPAARRLRAWLRSLGGTELLHAHDAHAVTLALLAAEDGVPVVASRRVSFPSRRNPLSRLKLRRVAQWLAVSRAAAAGLVRAGVAPERVEIVPSGLTPRDPAPASLRARLGLAADSFLVLTAGRLEAAKGQRTFVEACGFAGDLAGTRWVIAGAGPDLPFLQALARSRGVEDRVLFAGDIADLHRYLSDAQLYVAPSYSEGLGLGVLDALAAGVPVVASDTEGLSEVLADGAGGVLVPIGDARALARAVRGLYLDAARRSELAERARLRAEAFPLTRTVEKTLAAYARALAGTHLPRQTYNSAWSTSSSPLTTRSAR